MAIHVLDKHTAELIAAGEVVERPSSVIKELCENAIDAGSRNITVEIERGGIALMRVQDDGSGIEAADIPLAFIRHATSKVRTKQDLESINTLGFRGEALASIASVARVELLTMTEQDEFASLYRIEGGQELEIEAAARPVGTTITVRDLFYNTPARMKFLKKDTSEGTFVTETVTRLALSHPEVAVLYKRDGKTVFQTGGQGDLHATVYAVLGRDFAKELLGVQHQVRQYTVNGLVTPPRLGRASRAMQYFFINGRFVKNRTMMAALEQAYRGMVMHGKFPGCVLFLHMPPQLVDVNVHPAKTEVRFARESDIFDAVYGAVKVALMAGQNSHGSIQLSAQPESPSAPVAVQPPVRETPQQSGNAQPLEPVAKPQVEQGGAAASFGQLPTAQRIKNYNTMVDALASTSEFAPYETSKRTGGQAAFAPKEEYALSVSSPEETTPSAPNATESLKPENPPKPVEQQAFTGQKVNEEAQQVSLPGQQQETLVLVGEVFKTYILAQKGNTLCVIDKHAAHERILYEQLAAARTSGGIQQLLTPVAVALSANEKNALLQNEAALQAAGLQAEDFGGNEVVVRGVPADVEPDDVADLVVEIAGRLALNSRDTTSEKTQWVLHSMACRAAVKAGDATKPQEMLKLAQDIMEGKVPPYCPHGRPVVLEITRKELEKQFGRLG